MSPKALPPFSHASLTLAPPSSPSFPSPTRHQPDLHPPRADFAEPPTTRPDRRGLERTTAQLSILGNIVATATTTTTAARAWNHPDARPAMVPDACSPPSHAALSHPPAALARSTTRQTTHRRPREAPASTTRPEPALPHAMESPELRRAVAKLDGLPQLDSERPSVSQVAAAAPTIEALLVCMQQAVHPPTVPIGTIYRHSSPARAAQDVALALTRLLRIKHHVYLMPHWRTVVDLVAAIVGAEPTHVPQPNTYSSSYHDPTQSHRPSQTTVPCLIAKNLAAAAAEAFDRLLQVSPNRPTREPPQPGHESSPSFQPNTTVERPTLSQPTSADPACHTQTPPNQPQPVTGEHTPLSSDSSLACRPEIVVQVPIRFVSPDAFMRRVAEVLDMLSPYLPPEKKLKLLPDRISVIPRPYPCKDEWINNLQAVILHYFTRERCDRVRLAALDGVRNVMLNHGGLFYEDLAKHVLGHVMLHDREEGIDVVRGHVRLAADILCDTLAKDLSADALNSIFDVFRGCVYHHRAGNPGIIVAVQELERVLLTRLPMAAPHIALEVVQTLVTTFIEHHTDSHEQSVPTEQRHTHRVARQEASRLLLKLSGTQTGHVVFHTNDELDEQADASTRPKVVRSAFLRVPTNREEEEEMQKQAAPRQFLQIRSLRENSYRDFSPVYLRVAYIQRVLSTALAQEDDLDTAISIAYTLRHWLLEVSFNRLMTDSHLARVLTGIKLGKGIVSTGTVSAAYVLVEESPTLRRLLGRCVQAISVYTHESDEIFKDGTRGLVLDFEDVECFRNVVTLFLNTFTSCDSGHVSQSAEKLDSIAASILDTCARNLSHDRVVSRSVPSRPRDVRVRLRNGRDEVVSTPNDGQVPDMLDVVALEAIQCLLAVGHSTSAYRALELLVDAVWLCEPCLKLAPGYSLENGNPWARVQKLMLWCFTHALDLVSAEDCDRVAALLSDKHDLRNNRCAAFMFEQLSTCHEDHTHGCRTMGLDASDYGFVIDTMPLPYFVVVRLLSQTEAVVSQLRATTTAVSRVSLSSTSGTNVVDGLLRSRQNRGDKLTSQAVPTHHVQDESDDVDRTVSSGTDTRARRTPPKEMATEEEEELDPDTPGADITSCATETHGPRLGTAAAAANSRDRAAEQDWRIRLRNSKSARAQAIGQVLDRLREVGPDSIGDDRFDELLRSAARASSLPLAETSAQRAASFLRYVGAGSGARVKALPHASDRPAGQGTAEDGDQAAQQSCADGPISKPSWQFTFEHMDELLFAGKHFVGVLYVGECDETAEQILSRTSGSALFFSFLRELGEMRVVPKTCTNNPSMLSNGGDAGETDEHDASSPMPSSMKSPRTESTKQDAERDKDETNHFVLVYTQRAHEVIFDVSVMLPMSASSSEERTQRRKEQIANTCVNIVWNESGRHYDTATIPTDCTKVYIVISPSVRPDVFRVTVLSRVKGKQSFGPLEPGPEGYVVPRHALALLVRLTAVNASSLCDATALHNLAMTNGAPSQWHYRESLLRTVLTTDKIETEW